MRVSHLSDTILAKYTFTLCTGQDVAVRHNIANDTLIRFSLVPVNRGYSCHKLGQVPDGLLQLGEVAGLFEVGIPFQIGYLALFLPTILLQLILK